MKISWRAATKFTLLRRQGPMYLFVLPFVCINLAQAQLLDYTTFAGYGIGKGIMGNDYTTPLASCITGTTSNLAASQSAVQVSIVYNSNQYNQAFHIDQNAQASFLGIGGGDSLQFGDETSTSGKFFDIVIEAYSELPSNTIDNVKWDSPYDAMISSGDPTKIQAVRASCGDRYVETVFNEARLFLVMHVSTVQSSSLLTFSGKVNGSIDLDVVSAQAALGGDLTIKTANQSGALSFSVYSIGYGTNAAATLELIGIANSDGLADIAPKVSAALIKASPPGQPVKYQLAPLPGIPSGDLTDQRIFNYLTQFKGEFATATSRSNNIASLLSPSDPRRALINQPQGDAALNSQQTSLSNYLNAVATAHDQCRKAADLSVCVSAAQGMVSVPTPVNVELPPLGPPSVGPYTIWTDGNPVLPGQDILMSGSNVTSLLAGGQALSGSASNVDIGVPLADPYISSIDMAVINPAPPGPTTIGVLPLRLSDLQIPPYWSTTTRPEYVINLLHADGQNSCPFHSQNGLIYVDQSCLTAAALKLQAVALADVAQYGSLVSSGQVPPVVGQMSIPISAPITDCISQVTSGNFASLGLTLSKDAQNANNVAAQYFVFVNAIAFNIPIIAGSESHDPTTWQQLAQSRLSSLESFSAANGSSGSGVCSAKVP
jgi:hypothetical protein